MCPQGDNREWPMTRRGRRGTSTPRRRRSVILEVEAGGMCVGLEGPGRHRSLETEQGKAVDSPLEPAEGISSANTVILTP